MSSKSSIFWAAQCVRQKNFLRMVLLKSSCLFYSPLMESNPFQTRPDIHMTHGQLLMCRVWCLGREWMNPSQLQTHDTMTAVVVSCFALNLNTWSIEIDHVSLARPTTHDTMTAVVVSCCVNCWKRMTKQTNKWKNIPTTLKIWHNDSCLCVIFSGAPELNDQNMTQWQLSMCHVLHWISTWSIEIDHVSLARPTTHDTMTAVVVSFCVNCWKRMPKQTNKQTKKQTIDKKYLGVQEKIWHNDSCRCVISWDHQNWTHKTWHNDSCQCVMFWMNPNTWSIEIDHVSLERPTTHDTMTAVDVSWCVSTAGN